MTTSVLEKPETVLTEVNKEELCKKLCLNIFEGLLEGYEELKQKNPVQAEQFESKITELKTQRDHQKVLI
ncbi:MAG: hypothetical protein A2039_05070 [Candidatus Melainabacteria bacterium GWA2_34_9]|nr:MAG: hypothetical protein A2039_05070 [Candidatus Melainabacteria bacterium GWA2_34_9]